MNYYLGSRAETTRKDSDFFYEKIAKLLHNKAKEKYPSIFYYFDLDLEGLVEDFFIDTISYCADFTEILWKRKKISEYIKKDCIRLNIGSEDELLINDLFDEVCEIVIEEEEAEQEAKQEIERNSEEYKRFIRAVEKSKLSDEEKLFFGC